MTFLCLTSLFFHMGLDRSVKMLFLSWFVWLSKLKKYHITHLHQDRHHRRYEQWFSTKGGKQPVTRCLATPQQTDTPTGPDQGIQWSRLQPKKQNSNHIIRRDTNHKSPYNVQHNCTLTISNHANRWLGQHCRKWLPHHFNSVANCSTFLNQL